MRQNYRMTFSVGALLFATFAFAQGEQKGDTTVAPNAPKTEIEDKASSGSHQSAANICEELASYAKVLEEKQQAQPPQNPGTAQNMPKGSEKPQQIDKPQHQSGQASPIPTDGNKERPKTTASELRIIAEKNDTDACRSTVRNLRRAGAALPPALIALAALKSGR